MKNKVLTKPGILLVLAICCHVSGQTQTISQDSLLAKFNRYREHALQEKLYAHIDRGFYLTGETMWFKIYSVDGTLHRPLTMSQVAYAEILDDTGSPVLQAKIELTNGRGSGSFFLPASLGSGHYKFRVYTSWMKNFPPQFYFNQVLTLVNPFLIPEKSPSSATVGLSVEFFPEGGRLVSGIESKVAFKISDSSGKGVSRNGFILNHSGDTVAAFSPHRFGLGHFSITPTHEQKYRAVLASHNRSFTFPEVHPSGYVMQLHDSGTVLRVSVKSKGMEQKDLYLFAHARQMVISAQRQSSVNDKASFALDKASLAEGISHLTIFDGDLQPVCERLYFTYPRKNLDITIATNQKVFAPRKKVTVSLTARAEGAAISPANMSLSVFRIDSLSKMNRMQINPYLWLGSDLTGTVESPAYYFGEVSAARTEAVDNLMLTHGWRRFDWKNILEKQPSFTYLPELRDHIVTAEITTYGEKLPSSFVHLGSPGKIVRAYGSWSNADGEVRFEIKDFYGPRRIILQADVDTTTTYEIKVRDPFSIFRDGDKPAAFQLSEKFADQLLSRSIAMQVQDIYYYDEHGERLAQPEVDSSAFYGKADATYLLDDYTRFPVMEEVMREYVPGVFVRKRKDGFHFIVVDHVNRGVLAGDPMVLVDGVPVLDVDDVMRMDPLRVKKLEVVKRQYYLGQSVFSGIVSYTTYRGDLGGLELDPRSVTLNYDGLQLRREFHKPVYGSDHSNDRLPDQRYLLHWEPDITMDTEGNHQLEFYTSDVPGQYLIVAEGINAAGYAGTATYAFTVGPADNQ